MYLLVSMSVFECVCVCVCFCERVCTCVGVSASMHMRVHVCLSVSEGENRKIIANLSIQRRMTLTIVIPVTGEAVTCLEIQTTHPLIFLWVPQDSEL